MENKYYVPNITEFHVGFEYQIEDLGDDGKSKVWRDQIFEGEETRTYFIEELSRKEIRVKYLDKEDIESLGFKHYSLSTYNYKEYSLERIGVDNKLSISHYGNCIFLGYIKNKSELKKLLKQLKI